MKAKQAVEQIKSGLIEGKDNFQMLCNLFRLEVDERVKLRAHNKKPTDGVVVSVVDEVSDWVWKVGRDANVLEEQIKLCVSTERGFAFAKYSITDPNAVKQLKDMRRAYLLGRPPIEVLTREGLDAISGMMIGQVMQDAKEFLEKKDGSRNNQSFQNKEKGRSL